MAVTFPLYNSFKTLLVSGSVQLASQTVKIALVADTYIPSLAHDEWADVSANEAVGAGYATGGATLSGVTITEASGVVTIDASDVAFNGVTVDFKYAILYLSGSIGGKTNPLIGYLTDPAAGEVSIVADNFAIRWPADGMFVVE